MNCPHCGQLIVRPLEKSRAGPATQHVLSVLEKMRAGHTIRAREVIAADLTPRQINNAFCYLQSRGLIERVSYGNYRKRQSSAVPAVDLIHAAHNEAIDKAIGVVRYWLKDAEVEHGIIESLMDLKRPSSAVGEEK
jgi:predicted transcriptional regulator of viral defense system